MRQQSPRLSVSTDSGVTVVELSDKKILDEVSITQISEQLGAIVAQSAAPRMVLDFTRVIHMSSSALGMLITLNKGIREKNGQLRLCSIQPAIYEVFVITRLNEMFTVSPGRKEAVDSLK